MSCLRDQGRFAFFMLLVILCSIYPDRYVAQQRLFESADPLQLRLEAPFRRMISEREGRFAAQMLVARHLLTELGQVCGRNSTSL